MISVEDRVPKQGQRGAQHFSILLESKHEKNEFILPCNKVFKNLKGHINSSVEIRSIETNLWIDSRNEIWGFKVNNKEIYYSVKINANKNPAFIGFLIILLVVNYVIYIYLTKD